MKEKKKKMKFIANKPHPKIKRNSILKRNSYSGLGFELPF